MTRHDTRPFSAAPGANAWPAARVAEARAVIADVAHHSDHLIRLACTVLVSHGESEAERRDARALLFVIEALQPLHRHNAGPLEREAEQ
jgi:hypothetical protein